MRIDAEMRNKQGSRPPDVTVTGVTGRVMALEVQYSRRDIQE